MLGAGVDMATIARHVGHASVTTTARCNGRSEAQQRAAVELLRYLVFRHKVVEGEFDMGTLIFFFVFFLGLVLFGADSGWWLAYFFLLFWGLVISEATAGEVFLIFVFALVMFGACISIGWIG